MRKWLCRIGLHDWVSRLVIYECGGIVMDECAHCHRIRYRKLR